MNLDYITRYDLRYHPDKVFLFGDNLLHVGMGGQAAEMRGEPNAIGIPTKKFPTMAEGSFFSDMDFEVVKVEIDEAFARIPEGAEVIVPKAGLGTGLAELDRRAPKIFAYIQLKVERAVLQGKKYTEREALLCDYCRGDVKEEGDGYVCLKCGRKCTVTEGLIREEVKGEK